MQALHCLVGHVRKILKFVDAAEKSVVVFAVAMIGEQLVVDHVFVGPDEVEYGADMLLIVVNAWNNRSTGDEGLVWKRFVRALVVRLDAGVIRPNPLLVALPVGELVIV